jgi:hypothetical protein
MSGDSPAPLRAAARVALPVGAAGTLALYLFAGRHTPRLLLVGMGLWVLSPFAALLVARAAAARHPERHHAALDGAALLIALATPAVYATAVFAPLMARPTPAFVLVPPLSWLLVAAAAQLGAGPAGDDRNV